MQMKYIRQMKSKTDRGDNDSFQYVKAQQGLLYKSMCLAVSTGVWFTATEQQDLPDLTHPAVGVGETQSCSACSNSYFCLCPAELERAAQNNAHINQIINRGKGGDLGRAQIALIFSGEYKALRALPI